MGSKFTAINTSDHRLAMMGFTHPDSTQLKRYVHKRGDLLEHRDGEYERGWYWIVNTQVLGYSFSKRSIVKQMEDYYGKA